VKHQVSGYEESFGTAQGPIPSDQAAVPPQDGTWGDQPVNPQPWRQVLDQRGEDGAVGPVQPGPRTRPAQHGDLMPQHEQLRILGCGGPAEQDQPAAEPHEDETEKAHRHESS